VTSPSATDPRHGSDRRVRRIAPGPDCVQGVPASARRRWCRGRTSKAPHVVEEHHAAEEPRGREASAAQPTRASWPRAPGRRRAISAASRSASSFAASIVGADNGGQPTRPRAWLSSVCESTTSIDPGSSAVTRLPRVRTVDEPPDASRSWRPGAPRAARSAGSPDSRRAARNGKIAAGTRRGLPRVRRRRVGAAVVHGVHTSTPVGKPLKTRRPTLRRRMPTAPRIRPDPSRCRGSWPSGDPTAAARTRAVVRDAHAPPRSRDRRATRKARMARVHAISVISRAAWTAVSGCAPLPARARPPLTPGRRAISASPRRRRS
jgi:hypothetical protein